MTFSNTDNKGNKIHSDVIAWAPKKITTTGAEDVVVKKGSGIVANLRVVTEGISVTIKDGTVEVCEPLTGVDEDDYRNTPIQLGDSITLSFSGAGTAYIIYR